MKPTIDIEHLDELIHPKEPIKLKAKGPSSMLIKDNTLTLCINEKDYQMIFSKLIIEHDPETHKLSVNIKVPLDETPKQTPQKTLHPD